MDRRTFLVLAAAGVADPGSSPTIDSLLASPPAPAPVTSSGDAAFDAWSAQFRPIAIRAGIPAGVVDREMAGLVPDPRVVSRDGGQPEFNKPTGDYIRGVISDARIAAGRQKRETLTFLPGIEARYGVSRDILLGVWAMESAFGQIQGDFDVVRSLATLAASGRRRAWAETQLIGALRIIATGEASRSQLRGSWAGAMGQTQFIPDTYLSTAVDGDGDGRRDIWGSAADSLASAANLLAKAGWRRGEGWAREVTIAAADFDYSLTEGPKDPPAVWANRGVVPADGGGWSAADAASVGQLILPAGAAGPAFLIFPNHFVIRTYNNSTAYALGVGLLADRFAGGGPLVKAWPAETPLSLADRINAQQALQSLGFLNDAPDGVVGVNTRAALRAWQKARGLPADGYLSPDMVARLVAETRRPA